MNTEEIARIVADQRTYFKTHATFDVDTAAVRWCACAMRFVRTRAISPMRSRPIWVSHITRRICARSARRFRDSTSDCACGSMESSAPASV